MSKFAKTVAKVAGIVATVAQFIPGGQVVALVAGAVSAISGTLAQITAKPPRAVGQVTNITIGANQPIPYMIGRSYSGGAILHDVGYGGKVSDVDNPYRAMTIVYSGAGPISALVATQADFGTVAFSGTAASGYYSGFLWRDWLDGTGPAPRALVANFAGEPRWSPAHKLSGFFGVKYSLKFDKKGKVWQAGVPQFGVIGDGVRAYDPRLDSTRPGGVGSQRIDNEATWTFTKNPALHALTYAYGRYQNGKKVFGVDLGDAALDIPSAVSFANLCTANGWEVNGTIFEPGDKWNNLKLICEAGGGVPVPGARMRFDFNAPGVSVDTITVDDLGPDDISLPVTQGFASRINTVQGVYTSPNHRWEPVPTDKIVDTAALAADGEEKAAQFPFQLVTAKNQAAQLATYKMANAREKGPIVIPVKARLLTYPVGTFLTAQLPAVGLVGQKVKIIGKRRTMEDGSGELTLLTETDAKHAFALAATSGEPPTSELVPPERLDELAISLAQPISTQSPSPRRSDVADGHIYFDANRVPYRFTGLDIQDFADEEILDADGTAITGPGYDEVRDTGILQSLIDAAEAQAAADAAQAKVDVIASDNWLSSAEKPTLKVVHEALIRNYVALEAKATALGVAATEKAAATSAINALNAYLLGLSPTWTDVSTDTPWIGATARTFFDDAHDKVALLQAAVQGLPGATGPAGFSNAVVYLYQRAASAPAAPTGTFSYTFATGVLSGGTPGSWTQAIPAANGNPLWVIAATASAAAATDSIPAAEFSAAVLKDGAGLNAAPVFLYQRAASTPAVPAATLTYTFASGILTGTLGSWTQGVPTGTNPLYVTTATAVSTGLTDTIATGEWAAPVILAQNGTNGTNGTNGSNGSTGPVAPTLTCTPPLRSIPCTFNGTPKAAVPGFQINVFQGTTNVSATASYGAITASGISGAAVSSAGVVTVTGMTAETGFVQVPVTYAGVTMLARADYTKTRDGTAALSGSAAVTSLVNTATYAVSASFNITVPNGITLNCSGYAEYAAGGGIYQPQVKLAYVNVTDSGAQTDIAGSEASGTSATAVPPPEDGACVSSGSFTNSTGASKVFNVRFLSRRLSGGGTANTVSGSVGATGS